LIKLSQSNCIICIENDDLATIKAPQTIYLIKDSNDASHRQIKELRKITAYVEDAITFIKLKV